MKICILTETFHPDVGGGETQARRLASSLTEAGHGVLVLTRRTNKRQKKNEVMQGYPVYRLCPTGKQHLKKWGLMITCLPMLVRLRNHYDLIFVSGFRVVGVSAVLVARTFQKSVLLKADNNGEMSGDFFQYGLARFGLPKDALLVRWALGLRNAVLKQADGFVAISSDILAEIVSGGVAPSRIHAIPNSVDTTVFHPVSPAEKSRLRRALEMPERASIVIYTGRLVSYKGLPNLLGVWKQLTRTKKNWKLVLVGSGSLDIHNIETDLRQFVRENHMLQSVLFAGQVDNVANYLQASDLFVFPTEEEAFGISLIEAMACGLPVVATHVGGLKDILTHKQNGWIVGERDADQLQHAIEVLLTDPHLAGTLGAAARETILERYAETAVTSRFIQLFEEAIQTVKSE